MNQESEINLKIFDQSERDLQLATQDLLCCVCFKLMLYPIDLKCPSKHPLCLDCLQQLESSKCPIDRYPIKQKQLIKNYTKNIHQGFQQALNTLRVKCKPFDLDSELNTELKSNPQFQRYLNPRCKWVGYLKDYGNHLLLCPESKRMCQLCVPRHDITVKKSDCILQRNPPEIKIPESRFSGWGLSTDEIQEELPIQNQKNCPATKIVNKQEIAGDIVQYSCLGQNHKQGCLFDLQYCHGCEMFYFIFTFKPHYGKCRQNLHWKQKYSQIVMQLDKKTTQITNITSFHISILNLLFPEANLSISANMGDIRPKLNIQTLEEEIRMYNFWVLFQYGTFMEDSNTNLIPSYIDDSAVNYALSGRRLIVRNQVFSKMSFYQIKNIIHKNYGLRVHLIKQNKKRYQYRFSIEFENRERLDHFKSWGIYVGQTCLKCAYMRENIQFYQL